MPMLSPSGWALSIMATLTIIMQAPNLYNPSAFMTEFNLASKPAAQLIGKSVFDTRTVPHASKTSQTCFEFPLYGFAYPI